MGKPPIESQIEPLLRQAAAELLGHEWTGPVPVEVSNRPELGDYASAVAFALAKPAGRPPFEVASFLAERLSDAKGPGSGLVSEAVATPPAFVNIRLSAAALEDVVRSSHALAGALGDSDEGRGVKIVVEHTNVNPNKAAHVGHYRNACLGDSVARLLRRRGHDVEVQNYIDDTGVQVADIVVGLRELGLERAPGQTFDRFCSDVYVQVRAAYDADPGLLERRAQVQHALESSSGDLAAFAKEVTTKVAVANLRTMTRSGVEYDLLTWESDILALGFWQSTFNILKEKGAIRYEDSGPNAGCWVLPFGQGTVETESGTQSDDKVLVTRQGIVTYTGKDLAYQMWKFGLLEKDFRYRRFPHDIGQGERALWTTTSAAGDGEAVPAFAHADRVINVIDASQSYPQQVVYEGLRRIGFDAAAEASEHLAYGYVTLTPAAARSLGVDVEEGATKVAMSGRAGLQVFADDLLDRLEALVGEGATRGDPAKVAVAAARYYMLKFSNNQEIAFDFEDALRTTGETGVYLQYAYVRAGSILRKVGQAPVPTSPPSPIPDHDRALVLRMADYSRVVATAASDRSVLTLAKYAFELCSAFSSFYDNTTPVVAETDAALKAWRIDMVAAFRLVLGDVLEILGIPRLDEI